MRHISFALTTPQILDRSKTVTRRIGWTNLQPGTLLQAIEKGQGLKKGEKVRKLAVIRVTAVDREPLWFIRDFAVGELAAEGFPNMSAESFIEMFCDSHRISEPPAWPSLQPTSRRVRATDEVTRIEFEYLDVATIFDRYMEGADVASLALEFKVSPSEIEAAIRSRHR